ncbi:ATP-binding cassette domain-containing protein, partial [Bacillus cereus]|uniref:ATP-binding cassette domain-containing protein n=1 Tax=Bacillus cereus TaxID=1396 RepID=UPI00201BEEC3
MLEIKNFHKSFGGNEILKGVDLAIDKGDVVVILRPSGSGKTTLLRCINFFEKADQGHATFRDIPVDFQHVKRWDVHAIR